jgi:hypothetical protein
VAPSGTVRDFEVELFHIANPSCLLADRFRNTPQPLQSRVVRPDLEPPPHQVMMKILQKVDYRQQLSSSYAVVALSS